MDSIEIYFACSMLIITIQNNYIFIDENLFKNHEFYKFYTYLNNLLFLNSIKVDGKEIEEINSWQDIKNKPFLEYNNKYYISNPFAAFYFIGEVNYWTVRNYYNQNDKGDEFTANFGYYFEEYVKRLLIYYFGREKVHKIPELNNKKQPDFRIELKGITLFLEIKSTMKGKYAFDTYNVNSKLYETKYIDTLKEAAEQLANKKTNSNKKIFNLVISYEFITLIGSLEEELKSKYHEPYIFLGIDDLEILCELYKKSPGDFYKILEEKNKIIDTPGENRNMETFLTKKKLNSGNVIEFVQEYIDSIKSTMLKEMDNLNFKI